MPLPAIIAAASKLLTVASVVPDVIRAFGGDRQADAAEKMISVARALTGESDPQRAADMIVANPALQLEYQRMLSNERLDFKKMEYADKQHAHEQQQETIRSGDNSVDPYVRETRPKIARQSWYGTLFYVLAAEGLKIAGYGTGASLEIAMVLLAPCAAYYGFRTGDKFAQAWRERSK